MKNIMTDEKRDHRRKKQAFYLCTFNVTFLAFCTRASIFLLHWALWTMRPALTVCKSLPWCNLSTPEACPGRTGSRPSHREQPHDTRLQMWRHLKDLGTLHIPSCFCNKCADRSSSHSSSFLASQPDSTQRGRDPSGGGEGRQRASWPAFQSAHTSKVFTTSHLPRGLSCSSSPSVSCAKASAALLLLDPLSQRNARKENKTPALSDIGWRCPWECALSTPILSRPGGLSHWYPLLSGCRFAGRPGACIRPFHKSPHWELMTIFCDVRHVLDEKQVLRGQQYMWPCRWSKGRVGNAPASTECSRWEAKKDIATKCST